MPGRLNVEQETLTDTYGKFHAAPFERGFGTTVGNSIRRALLSSIEGAAITAVEITGVEHEFSSIKGVVEDATDGILNLKQVRFKKKVDHDVTQEKITLSIKNKSDFTAAQIGDVTQNFDVMNPDQLICTLDGSAKMEIELTIAKGRGYVSAEDNKVKEAPFGYIPTDSIFTPIKNVKYSIENTRVEQRTDFEKLIMEVSTDGTIHRSEEHTSELQSH